MNKARPFRTRLWLYFILFAAVIFSLLWILQTVFLQNFYNGMLAKNTCAAAEEIAEAKWFDRNNCPASPKPGSIAYKLIHRMY